MRGTAQIQPINVLEKKLCRPRGEEIVSRVLAGLHGHRGGSG